MSLKYAAEDSTQNAFVPASIRFRAALLPLLPLLRGGSCGAQRAQGAWLLLLPLLTGLGLLAIEGNPISGATFCHEPVQLVFWDLFFLVFGLQVQRLRVHGRFPGRGHCVSRTGLWLLQRFLPGVLQHRGRGRHIRLR